MLVVLLSLRWSVMPGQINDIDDLEVHLPNLVHCTCFQIDCTCRCTV